MTYLMERICAPYEVIDVIGLIDIEECLLIPIIINIHIRYS